MPLKSDQFYFLDRFRNSLIHLVLDTLTSSLEKQKGYFLDILLCHCSKGFLFYF